MGQVESLARPVGAHGQVISLGANRVRGEVLEEGVVVPVRNVDGLRF